MAYIFNTKDGSRLDQQCDHCIFDKDYCPIKKIHLRFNVNQLNNDDLMKAMDMLVEQTTFTCAVFNLLDNLELL